MRRTIQSLNIPPGNWTFEDRFVQIPAPGGKNCVQMPHPISFAKRKISDCNFLPLDQASKSNLEDLFFWAICSRKWNIYLEHLHTKRYHTCNPLERLETYGLTSPPLPGKVQTPHPPGQGRWSNARYSGGCWSLDLIGALQAHMKSWRIAYNLT